MTIECTTLSLFGVVEPEVSTSSPCARTDVPDDIARYLPGAVARKVGQMPRQLATLRALGWTREEVEAECVATCVTRMASPRSRYDPARGDLGGWVYTVCRSRVSNLINRSPDPTTGGARDVGEGLVAHADPWVALEDWGSTRNRGAMGRRATPPAVDRPPRTPPPAVVRRRRGDPGDDERSR